MVTIDDVVNSIPVQQAIFFYLQDLGPTLNHGRYYLHRIIRFYLRSGCTAPTKELVKLTAEQYHCTPKNISSCIDWFIKDIFRREDAELYLWRWRKLGWDDKTRLTASKAISLACKGFYPYARQRYLETYCQLMNVCPPPTEQK